jgi:hypothetical protein
MAGAGRGHGDAERREALADRLDAVAEELADLALESLREALERGETGRPADERRLTQARRAVEKASHLLRAGDGRSADDGTADG